MKEKKSGKAFAIAQQIGKSLFLPIAILPAAGILLGIGSSFSNEATIATYGLSSILHSGTILYSLMLLFTNVGKAVFDNLPLIFALGVALGMAKKEKGVAVLSAGIFYLIMITTIGTLLRIDGSIVNGVVSETVKSGAIASVLGIQTLQMGVFGGIVAGLAAAAICNKFYKQELPSAFAFFSGTRFVPIMSIVFAVLSGGVLYLVWPLIQNGIFALGNIVESTGYFGSFFYGCIQRVLVPFGLHHIFYMPFWQTGVGGTAIIDGVTIMGAQNIFFAQLASPNTAHFSVEACRFLTGPYAFMIGGLPGAALAMFVCAKDKKKKYVSALLLSAAFTSILTGITEPIEFTFLFLAPFLYGIHVVFAGLAHAITHFLGICIGTTFSQGLIDFILYGVLPGQAKTNWMMMIPLIIIYFVLYFIVFRFFILKWDLKTPGREGDDEEGSLITKDQYLKARAERKAKIKSDIDWKSAEILSALGGMDNVEEIDCCATRLRLTLADESKVDETRLKATGAAGVVTGEKAIQVIYGPSVTIVKSNLEEYIEKLRSGEIKISDLTDISTEEEKDDEPIIINDENSDKSALVLASPMTGSVLSLHAVQDEVFASGALGQGIAIEPDEGKLYSPIDAEVVSIFDTKHCIGLITTDGLELLLHIGIDTVKLGGAFFETHVQIGQKINKGDLLISFEMDNIKKSGYLCTTPIIICNADDEKSVIVLASDKINAGDDLLEIK